MPPVVFGYNCWRVSKEENGRAVIKLLLRDKGKSFALALPYFAKVYYAEPPAGGSALLPTTRIACKLLPLSEANRLKGVPAQVSGDARFPTGKAALSVDTRQVDPIGDLEHAAYILPGQMLYYQASPGAGETVVVISELIPENNHPLYLRSEVSNGSDEVVAKWLLGGAEQSFDLQPLPAEKIQL